MNKEAFSLLKCQVREGEEDNPEVDLAEVFCYDPQSCAILTPLDQLINFLTNVDGKLRSINKDAFL